jgi:hypothetical protein
MPFRLLATSHMAGSHLSSPKGESSMTVPVFSVNCRRGWRLVHCQRLCFGWKVTFSLPQVGQTTPLGQATGHHVFAAVVGLLRSR